MKKILNVGGRVLPSLVAILGLVIMFLSAGSDEFGILHGSGSPVMASYLCWAGLALFGIGCVASRINEARYNARRNKR